MALSLRVPWRRQPSTPPKVDWNHPFSRALVFAWTPLSPVDAASKAVYPPGSGSTRIADTPGVALVGDGTVAAVSGTANSTLTTSDGGAGNGDFTFLSYSAPLNEATLNCLISQCSGSGGYQTYILANTTTGFAAQAGTVSFQRYPGQAIQATGITDGRPHVFVSTSGQAGGPGDARLFVDGVQKASGTGASSKIWDVGTTNLIQLSGINGYTSWFRATPHYCAMAWNRILTPDEVAQISRNPWQLFIPHRRLLYFGPPAAAADTFFGQAVL